MHECDAVRDNLAAYQDGDLEPEMRAQIKAHLGGCAVCRQEARNQSLMRERLRALKRATADTPVPPHVWANATRAWNRQDSARRRRVELRFALVAACVLLLAFGIVWAGLTTTTDFPVAAALRDFRSVRPSPPRPQYATQDADRAARWLRVRLHATVPPLDLSLSRAMLLGADVVPNTTPPLGRLLYRSPRGLIALYIAPRGTNFRRLAARTLDGRDFLVEDSANDVGFYGWRSDMIGYGLALEQPIANGQSFALDAEHATEHPTSAP